MKKIFSERKAIRKPLTSKADDLVAVVVHAVNNFSENSPPEEPLVKGYLITAHAKVDGKEGVKDTRFHDRETDAEAIREGIRYFDELVSLHPTITPETGFGDVRHDAEQP